MKKTFALFLASTSLLLGSQFADAYTMPSGAVGIWNIDQYSATQRPTIPNSVSSTSTSPNLFSAPRNLFSNSEWWVSGGTTIVDSAATAPDGTMSASTLNGTGNWILHQQPVILPAGTYTMAVSAKRNTGTDQQFAFYKDNTGTRSSANTATSVWQRFSYTFTLGSPDSINRIGLGSIDGSTGANIQITDFELYSGSSDLGPENYGGHLYLGASAFDTAPSYAGGALDLSAGGYGLIQFPTTQNFSTITVQALVSKVADGTAYQSILSKAQGYQDLSAMTEQGTVPASYFNGSVVGPTQSSGLWNAKGKGYHVVTLRYDGTNFDYWIDDVRVLTNAVVETPVSVSDLFVNLTNSTGLYGGNKFAGFIGLWDRGLSDAEVRNSVAIQQARAASSSITTQNVNNILVAEGDSVTGAFGYSYPYLYGPNASSSLYGVDYAISGSTVTNLVDRAPLIDGIIPPNTAGRKFILSVLIGTNDLGGGVGAVPSYLTNLAAYLDTRRAAGWKVVLGTVPPRTASGFNDARNLANATIRTWVGTHADAIVDFAADPTMGPDAAASDTSLYADGTHPTASGQAILEAVYKPVIDRLFSSVAPTVTSSDVSQLTAFSATLNGTITSDGNASSTDEGFNYGSSDTYGNVASTTGTFDTGSFSQTLSGLSPSTTYHYQAFAINSGGTGTSSDQTFTTLAAVPATSGYGGASYVPMYSAGTAPVAASSTTATSSTSGAATTTDSTITPPTDLGCLAGFLFSITTGHSCVSSSPAQANAPTSGTTHYTFLKNLSYHATGSEVFKLQQYLASQGLFTATPNSIFGPITLSSLIKFQKLHAITPANGYFGPLTRAYINGLI